MSEPPAKRHKIKKACDNCRTRKIKCDGKQPCLRCSTNSTQCQYTHVEKKRVVKRKDPKQTNGSIESLDNRMNKMESLITTLIEKLNGPGGVANDEPITPDSKETLETTDSTSDETSLESSPEAEQYIGQCHYQHMPEDQQNQQDIPTRSAKELPAEEKFIGSQSSLSVLSPRGVMWLGKKSNDPNLENGFKSLVKRSHSVFYQYLKPWMEPIDSNQVVPLPSKTVFYELINYFRNDLRHFTFVVTYEELYKIAENYYNFQEGKRHRHVTNSDYLIMNSAITLAVTYHYERVLDDQDSLAKYQALEDRHLKNAIYYFHRVLVVGEGISSIQGILLLVSHTNSSLLPQANFMLISTAVRLAQGMGLHRTESLVGLSPDEYRKRRALWWCCYLSDRINCLKAGKPMTINELDMSPMESDELRNLLFNDFAPDIIDKILSGEWNLMDPNIKDKLTSNMNPDPNVNVGPLITFFVSGFFKFTSEAYDKLFCATALSGKTADQIMELIETLNFKLESINDNIPSSFRPGTELKLGVYNGMVDHHLLMLHFAYYLHIMIINRMSFKRSWLNHDHNTDDNSKILPRQRKSIKKCLDAARNILKIVQRMDTYKCSFFNISLFVFFSSFFTLLTACIEFPTAPETKNDLNLMKDTAEGLFSKLLYMIRKLGDDKMVLMIDHMTKYFLRVGILVFNTSNQEQIDITSIERDLKNYEQSFDQEQSQNSRKRKKHSKSNNGTQEYSPNNPSSLSHVHSASGYLDHDPNGSSSSQDHNQRPSQPNTPGLNNLLNDPIPNVQSPGNYAPSIRSTASSTTDNFDPFRLGDEVDLSSNSNVFQQLFPIPNLYFGAENGNSIQGFPGHFEW